MEYFILVLAAVCIAAQFNVNKVYQQKFVSGIADMLFFPFVCGIVNLIFFTLLGLCLYGRLPEFSVFSFLMSIVLALISTLSFAVGLLIMKYGKISAYSVFMMLGGMILPYFYGVIMLDEAVSAARIIGLIILVCALPCSVLNPDKKSDRSNRANNMKFYYMLCVFIFIINGCTSIISKVHSINTSAIPAVNFIVYVNLWQMIINGAAYFIFSRKQTKSTVQENTQNKSSGKNYMVLTITAYAIVSGVGFLFQLISAETVPAVALYPFITGGSIILSTIGARIFFKEKISMLMLVGIIMSFAGTVLFLFS